MPTGPKEASGRCPFAGVLQKKKKKKKKTGLREQVSNWLRLESLCNPLNGLTLVTDNEVQVQTLYPFHLLRALQLDTSEVFAVCSFKLSPRLPAPPAMEMRKPTGESHSSLPFWTHSHTQRPLSSQLLSGESTLSLTGSHAYT